MEITPWPFFLLNAAKFAAKNQKSPRHPLGAG
jgi:hypothetical protein